MNENRIWTAMKYLAGGLLIIMLLMLLTPAFSQHECQGGHNCNDDNGAIIDASTVVTGDSSWGIGAGGPGDVDIRDCLGSTQWGALTIFKQKLVTNENCLGFRFLAIGQYKLAALHFCNDKDTLKEYTNEAQCEVAHDFTPPEDETGVIGSLDETYVLAQQQEIEYLQEENASIVVRLEILTEKLEQRPATVSSQVQTQIQQQESDAERRRARAKEAYQKAREGSE